MHLPAPLRHGVPDAGRCCLLVGELGGIGVDADEKLALPRIGADDAARMRDRCFSSSTTCTPRDGTGSSDDPMGDGFFFFPPRPSLALLGLGRIARRRPTSFEEQRTETPSVLRAGEHVVLRLSPSSAQIEDLLPHALLALQQPLGATPRSSLCFSAHSAIALCSLRSALARCGNPRAHPTPRAECVGGARRRPVDLHLDGLRLHSRDDGEVRGATERLVALVLSARAFRRLAASSRSRS